MVLVTATTGGVRGRMGEHRTAQHRAALDAALSTDALRMLFQPVVDLASGELVGHEALARGPRGSALESPQDLFAAARACGELQQLDWACRCAAFRQAVDRDVPRGWRLFVNAEPQVLGTACPAALVGDWVDAHRRLDVVVEVTERYLMHRPADLVGVLATLRELRWEIALDDAGANDAGVALLPVLQPDIVKLDASLLRESLSPERRTALRAIADYIERSGAVLLAEGIETSAHLARAQTLGASWGQGWLFGRPAPLGDQSTATSQVVPRVTTGRPFEALPGVRPFELLGLTTPTVLADPGWLAEQVTSFCDLAADAPHAGVLLLSLGEPGLVPAGAFRRLDTLSDVCALVAVLAVDPPARRPGAVRVTELAAQDTWADQYAAVVLGPRTARALVARRCDDGRYETYLTEDPDDVAALARLLLLRLDPVRL
jgi:EAL domain-containing protein (putative c-di-GMP-specific phosphodiesterase class I)